MIRRRRTGVLHRAVIAVGGVANRRIDDVDYPAALGSDFAGEVVELAPGVADDRLSIGTRMVGMVAEGAYADEVVAPAALLHPMPPALGHDSVPRSRSPG